MTTSEGTDIAEELASQQREISVAEFFEQNRQMLGFGSKARGLVTAVKEGVDNAIDAAEEASILPEVQVTIKETDEGHYALTILDNGPGITEEKVPKVFGKLLYGSRFSTRVQRRGQQGIGISAAVMYGQLTTGKPAEVMSKIKTQEKGEYFKVGIDTDENEPEIREANTVNWPHQSESGTSITIYLEGNFRARSSLHKYINHTAIVNPHATIELDEPEKTVRYERTVDTLPTQPTEIKPHPHGIEFGTLRSLIEVSDSHSISGFLQSEFTRVGQTTANDIINAFMDRVEGRYCKWRVPEKNTKIPESVLEDGRPFDPDDPFINDSVETDRDGGDSKQLAESEEEITLENYIASHVNRKSPEATETFSTTIPESLRESGEVSWNSVRETTHSVADEVAEEYDITFGETVRNKAADATWRFIRTARETTLIDLVANATSDRKTRSDVKIFARALSSSLDQNSQHGDCITKKRTRKCIQRAASRVKEDEGNSFGETAQENIFETLWEGMDRSVTDPPLLREIESNRELADHLHSAMKEVNVMAPPSHCLSPIGENELVAGMKKVYNADFYSASTRDASAHSGEPFLVEAGIAHGGDLEEGGDVELLRFANRVPLVYQQGACSITSVVSGIRWNNYKISDKGSGLPQGPVAIVVHIASTNVPFTSESKDAVSSVEVIKNEIERAVRDAARDLKSHLDQQQSLQKRREKQDTIAKVLPEFSKKISALAGKDQQPVTHSLARIMNNLLITAENGKDNSTEVTVANFSRSETIPTVYIWTETKPQIGQSLELLVEEVNNRWRITWEPQTTDDGVNTMTVPLNAEDIEELTVDGVAEEKVTSVLPRQN